MKKVILFLCGFAFFYQGLSQEALTDSITLYTPGGVLDKVFDNTGGTYNLDDIRIKDKHVNYSPPSTNDNQALITPPLSTCHSGYFDLYFDEGSGMEIESDITHIARRNVICRAFKDVSDLIVSPLTNSGNTNKVNILIRNFVQMNNGSTNGSGISRTFYHAYPKNNPGFGGIVDNEIWKTINSGINSFANVSPPMNISAGGSANFYHGLIAFNFETVNWNLTLETSNFDWFLYDLYSTALHEITHTLGFYSHIKHDGTTSYSFMPYYTRYDKHLMNNEETEHLIVNTGSCSSMFNYIYNPSASMNPLAVLTPGCTNVPPTGGNQNNTVCNDAVKYVGSLTTPVYTPSCFENGSSFSHFEDQCVANSSGNDEYYCMSNVGYNGVKFDDVNQVYFKRLLKKEERAVLCDIGYNTNRTFGNATNFNNIDYGSSCINSSIVGFNDGWTNGVYSYNTFTNTPYLISDFLDNDILTTNNGSSKTYEYCIEDLTDETSIITYNNGTSFTFKANRVGLHLLRYVPKSSDGTLGNITYIYVFVERDCQISSSCNLVSNNGFELNDQNCGYIENTGSNGTGNVLDCWNPVIYTPDLFVRNCITDFGYRGIYSIPINNFGNAESWDGSPNNAFIGLVSYPQNVFEGIANHLSSTISQNQRYTIRFKAKQSIHFDNSRTSTGKISIAGSESLYSTIMAPLSAIPSNMTVLKEIEIISPNWQTYQETFVYNGTSDLNYLNLINSTNINNENDPNRQLSYVLIDDVELFVSTDPSISISMPEIFFCSSPTADITFSSTITNGGNNPGYQWKINGVAVAGATSATFTANSLRNGDVVTCDLTSGLPCVTNALVTSNPILIESTQNYSWANYTLPASNNFFQNQIIKVEGKLTIKNDVTFQNCEFRMQPNSEIVISSGLSKFVACHLYTCANEMWKGIDLINTGRISLEPGESFSTNPPPTLIEDALIAVEVYDYTGDQFFLNVKNVTFNKNYIGINIRAYLNYDPALNSSIVNSVFTCRDLPFTAATKDNPSSFIWPYTNDIKASYPNSDALKPQYVNETTFSSSNSNSKLKAPYTNQKAFKGIYLQGVGNITGNFPNYAHQSIKIGNHVVGEFNLFDNMTYGIHADNSNLNAANNIFQYIFSDNNRVFPGYGIYSNSEFRHPNLINYRSKIVVKAQNATDQAKNKFYRCANAIHLNACWEVDIKFVDIHHHITTAGIRNGIIINTAFFKQLDINNSNFFNLNNGVLINHINNNNAIIVVNGINYSYISGGMNINDNTLRDNFPGTDYSGRAMANAVTVNAQNIANTVTAVYVLPKKAINIKNNFISYAYRGIQAKNWNNRYINIGINTIYLTNENTNSFQYGIANINNSGANKEALLIEKNTVYGFSGANTNQAAIYSSMSSKQRISCNRVQTSHYGIKFDGNNPSTRFERNKMNLNTYGFVLDKTGIIGTQGYKSGTANYQSDNTWPTTGGWNSTHFKTATLNGSSAQDSKLYIRNEADYNPNGSGYTASQIGFTDYFSTGNNSTLLFSTTLNPLNCGNGNALAPATGQDDVVKLRKELERIARKELLYSYLPKQTESINELQLYRLLHAEKELRQSSPDLERFYQEHQTGNKALITQVEEHLAVGELRDAREKTAQISPGDMVEESYKSYYTFLLEQEGKSLPSLADSVQLYNLAALCPFSHGASVYQARSLYQAIYAPATVFTDDCEMKRGGNAGAASFTETSATTSTSATLSGQFSGQFGGQELEIYPNPNAGSFTIRLAKPMTATKTLFIYDNSGKLVKTLSLSFENSPEKKLDTDLENGVYFFKLKDENTDEQHIKKITVLH